MKRTKYFIVSIVLCSMVPLVPMRNTQFTQEELDHNFFWITGEEGSQRKKVKIAKQFLKLGANINAVHND